MKNEIKLAATSVFGVEAVVGRELDWLGYGNTTEIDNGRVTFGGDLSSICRSNLWLRTAERVLLKMGEFTAVTFDQLFEGTKVLPWGDWLPENAAFPVQASSLDSKLSSVPDCQAIIKKAIVEKLKQKYHKQSWFEENGPVYAIETLILKDKVRICIDTSGTGLHKRGYRILTGEAPLRETMAAAMLYISRWKGGRVLLDPFCGTGTIPIEAALISVNVAPGLKRGFAAEKWPDIPEKLWKDAREEALDLRLPRPKEAFIEGSDFDEKVLSLAAFHAGRAGVSDLLRLKKRAFIETFPKNEYGFIVCNPPYGERMGNVREIDELYKQMPLVFKRLTTWSFYVLTSTPEFETIMGKKADKRRKLNNGRIICNYYQYFGPKPPPSYKGQQSMSTANGYSQKEIDE
ncbi:MAG: class I SAM-dependent RNA methyltransferase [Clostridiales bacterium]|nr:class I SAM-dependent RNA methyltransferase [Clostridiales bacterium]